MSEGSNPSTSLLPFSVFLEKIFNRPVQWLYKKVVPLEERFGWQGPLTLRATYVAALEPEDRIIFDRLYEDIISGRGNPGSGSYDPNRWDRIFSDYVRQTDMSFPVARALAFSARRFSTYVESWAFEYLSGEDLDYYLEEHLQIVHNIGTNNGISYLSPKIDKRNLSSDNACALILNKNLQVKHVRRYLLDPKVSFDSKDQFIIWWQVHIHHNSKRYMRKAELLTFSEALIMHRSLTVEAATFTSYRRFYKLGKSVPDSWVRKMFF